MIAMKWLAYSSDKNDSTDDDFFQLLLHSDIQPYIFNPEYIEEELYQWKK